MTQNSSKYSVHFTTPSLSDYKRLRRVGGLSDFGDEAAHKGLAGTLFSVTVQYEDQIIGMGRIIGDGGCFFQIVDVVVDPAHQGRGLGKRVMSELMQYIDTNIPTTAFISLLADVPANKLYDQFGFNETAPESVGMFYRVP